MTLNLAVGTLGTVASLC